jgi:hypothetical protein
MGCGRCRDTGAAVPCHHLTELDQIKAGSLQSFGLLSALTKVKEFVWPLS